MRADDQPARGTERGSPGSESSIELMRRARHGDRGALDRLFRRTVPALRRWAHGQLPAWARDCIDTEDLVQDTLLRTLHNVDRFEHRRDGALQAYLRKVLKNRIRDEVRRTQRHPPKDSLPSREAAAGPSPLETAIGHEAHEAYERGLARLSALDQEAIIARIEMGMSYQQIASALGRPSADAARMTVTRALVRLAREMGHG